MHLLRPTFPLSERIPFRRVLLYALAMTGTLMAVLVLQLLTMPGQRRGLAVAWAIGMPLVAGPTLTVLPWLIARRANRETEAWTQAILAELHADRDHGPVAR